MLNEESSIAAAWKALLKTGLSKGQIAFYPEGADRPIRYSREQIFKLAVQISNALHRKLEVPKYGRVAIIGNIDGHFTAVCHGCWMGSYSLVLISATMETEMLVAAINNAEVDTVFFAMPHMMTMSKLIKSCPTVRHWVLTEGSGVNGHGTSLHVLNNLLGDTSKTIIASIEDETPDYPALITFTTGYNGKLVGVSFTQHQLLAGADNIVRHFDLRKEPTRTIATVLEPQHLVSLQFSTMVPLGCTNQISVYHTTFTKRFWPTIQKSPANLIFIDHHALDQVPKSQKAKTANLPDDACFHIVTNESLDIAKIKSLRSLTGRKVHPCYHQTEAGGLVSAVKSKLTEDMNEVRGVMCCGNPLAGIEAKITSADGKEALPAYEGEIELESDQVMLGYDATKPGEAPLSSETTIRTADRGFIVPTDDEGLLLYLVNRMQEEAPELGDAPTHMQPTEELDKQGIQCIDHQPAVSPSTHDDPSSLSELPPDIHNLQKLLALAKDPSARTPDMKHAFLQDPVLTIELIRTYQFASERSAGAPLQDIKDIIVLLGPSLIQELCEQLQDRQQFQNPTTAKWVNTARKRCVKAGDIAHVLAGKLGGSNPEEARLAAMLKEMGDLEIICKHPEAYVKNAETLSRVKLVYQMSKEFGFHPDNTATTYLKRMQCPQNLLELIDPEITPSAAEKTKLRMICKAASEVTELSSQGNLEKLSPDKTLSNRSALRVLQIPTQKYSELFEDFSKIIDKVDQTEVKATSTGAKEEVEYDTQQAPSTDEIAAEEPEVDDALGSFLDDLDNNEELETTQEATTEAIEAEDLEKPSPIMAPKLHIERPVPRFNTVAVDAMIAQSAAIIATAGSPMDKICSIMNSMIEKSPFTRSALVLVNFDTLELQVLEAIGMDFEQGGVFIIEDEQSPFLTNEVQIYSFSKQGRHKTHLGSLTYAMGPVVSSNNQTLLIYADCGPNEVLPFASRRMFRQLVALLQQHCGDVLDDDQSDGGLQEKQQ